MDTSKIQELNQEIIELRLRNAALRTALNKALQSLHDSTIVMRRAAKYMKARKPKYHQQPKLVYSRKNEAE